MLKPALIALSAGLALALAACSGSSADSSSSATPPTWWLANAPANPVHVAKAKASAKEGDTITIRGIIGGSATPITEGSPVFQIMDTRLDNPCLAEDDHCPTPWDYCCSPSEDLVANAATIQVVDTNGATVDLADSGLTPLTEVIVTGTVDARPDPKVLTIKATGVFMIVDG